MATILDRILNREKRSSIESPKVPISSQTILEYFGISSSGEILVTPEKVLGIPAVWAAVNFLSATLAALPLHVYKKGRDGPARQGGAIAALLNHSPNEEESAFAFRKWFWARVFTEGRGLAMIERDGERVVNLFGIDPNKTKIERKAGARIYTVSDGAEQAFRAREVIDVPFLLKADLVGHYGPLKICEDRIRTILGAERYGSKIFKNGGLPMFTIEGPFGTQEGASRAADQLAQASAAAFNKGNPALAMPAGHKINTLGIDPQKMQMVEFQRFLIEEIARIYQIPPVFLQDLTNNTFSNAEQQDLHLTKHLITQWCRAFESELDLKLFGRANGLSKVALYTSHNLDGLLRGDFKTRMEGLAQAVQNAILTPNEARALENRPSKDNGDDLLMQSATVPLGTQPGTPGAPAPAPVAPAVDTDADGE